MVTFTIRLIVLLIFIPSLYANGDTTCKQCHPLIYREYKHSIHANASIFKDPVYKAVWDKHPDRAKGDHKCAKCHTPADHQLLANKGLPKPNMVQLNQPISCQSCHTIKDIAKHAKTNTNIYTDKKKYFYSADINRKGQKIIFHEKKYLFGLLTKTTGSPYHDIDYSNENFYNGNMCLGCHDHKRNSKGFAVCDMQIKQSNSKETCITCHMPQVQGSLVNLKQTPTHAFHRISIHQTPVNLSKYVKLHLDKTRQGFTVTIENTATHTLFAQPLRLAQLRVEIERGSQKISLKPVNFNRIIGTDGKPSMPWTATEILKDTTIKAHEKRVVPFRQNLQQGDSVTIQFGYYIVNPQTAKKLGISNSAATHFMILTQKRFHVNGK